MPQQPCAQAQGRPRGTPASRPRQRCLTPSELPGETSVGDGSFSASGSPTSVPTRFLNCQEGARAATAGLGGFPASSWSSCTPQDTWAWAHGHSSSPASWPVGSGPLIFHAPKPPPLSSPHKIHVPVRGSHSRAPKTTALTLRGKGLPNAAAERLCALVPRLSVVLNDPTDHFKGEGVKKKKIPPVFSVK